MNKYEILINSDKLVSIVANKDQWGDYKAASFLLEWELSPSALQQVFKYNAMIFLVNFDSCITLELLLKRGMSPRYITPDAPEPIFAAVASSSNAARCLIGAGAAVNARASDILYADYTPLLLAIQHGNTESVLALLAAGADPYAVFECEGPRGTHDALPKIGKPSIFIGLTTLTFAVMNDKPQIFQILKDAAPDIEVQSAFLTETQISRAGEFRGMPLETSVQKFLQESSVKSMLASRTLNRLCYIIGSQLKELRTGAKQLFREIRCLRLLNDKVRISVPDEMLLLLFSFRLQSYIEEEKITATSYDKKIFCDTMLTEYANFSVVDKRNDVRPI